MSSLRTIYPAQINSPTTSLSGAIVAGQTTITVADASILPNAPNLLVLGGDTHYAETVLMTAKNISGNTLTIVRGVEGTDRVWAAGTLIGRFFTAKDMNDIAANIETLNTEKQEALTFDTSPTADSTNPVTSGGVYTAILSAVGNAIGGSY